MTYARAPASEYEALLVRIRRLVRKHLPRGSVAVVVSKGDPDFLRLNDCVGWHFPRADDGGYAGFYPEDGAAVVTHLEVVRRDGGEFFVLPAIAFWWLDAYPELREYLEKRCRLLVWEQEACAIYDLGHRGRSRPEPRKSSPLVRPVPERFSRPGDTLTICPSPVFIIGAPRSGKTTLAWSLNAHEDFFWTSAESELLFHLFWEGNHLERVYRTVRNHPSGTWLSREEVDWNEFVSFLAAGVNALFTTRSKGRRWVDHTALHTEMAELLVDMFPDAYFLHVVRDGRRVVDSMSGLLTEVTEAGTLAGLEAAGRVPLWATDFRDACRTWATWTRTAGEFCDRHPSRAMTIVNEQLSRDPERSFRELFEFLQAPHDERPARVFPRSEADSRIDESWHGWSSEKRRIFREEAGSTLVELGFASREELDGWGSS